MRDKAFNIAKNMKYDGYQRGLAAMFDTVFDKKTSVQAVTLANKSAIKNENISNKELTEEYCKPNIKKCKKRKLHTIFIDNIWGGDLADMELIIKFHKGFSFLLCVIDI